MTTTNAAAAPEGQGNNVAGAEGAGAQTATTEPTTPTTPEVKTFTQEDVNKIVQSRLAEERTKLNTKYEKELTDKLASARDEWSKSVETTIEERLQAKLNETALAEARDAIKTEYGLNDQQLARLTGTTADELKADAETLFGMLKQRTNPTPPIINSGGTPSATPNLDITRMTPAETRALTPEQRVAMLRRNI